MKVNPFSPGPHGNPLFFGRNRELTDLEMFAMAGENVTITSPHGYGKTSLLQALRNKLDKKGFVNSYCDFFPVASEKDVVDTLAKSFMDAAGARIGHKPLGDRLEGLFKKLTPLVEMKPEGVKISLKYDRDEDWALLLDDLLSGFGRFLLLQRLRSILVFDEFQEITTLKGSLRIEEIISSFTHKDPKISIFFVGSRRKLHREMFTDSNRPLHGCAVLYTLNRIPREEFSSYIRGGFRSAGKECSHEASFTIYDRAGGITFYVMEIAARSYDLSESACTLDVIEHACRFTMEKQKPAFEGIWLGLTNVQRRVLKALAVDPTGEPFSHTYMARYGFSLGGMQRALKTLLERDLVDKKDETTYQVIDPFFRKWLHTA